MTDLWQVRNEWTGTGGGMPGTNTIYASTGDTDIDDFRSALADFYDFWVTGNCSDDFSVTIPATGDKIDSGTGGVVGLWSSGTADVHTGTDTANRVPDIAQVLVQLRTDLVVSGRLLRGRIFLPGLRVTGTTGGELDPTIQSALQGAADDAFIGRACVFSRTHNTFATITATTVWNEIASLRSRRD
jgi:hypothetical protein